jgi:hypothetical protein
LSLDDEDPREMTNLVLHHPPDHTRYRALPRIGVPEIEPLLIEVLKDGQLVYDLPTIEAMRAQRRADMNRLDAGVRRVVSETQTPWPATVSQGVPFFQCTEEDQRRRRGTSTGSRGVIDHAGVLTPNGMITSPCSCASRSMRRCK